jgi:DUF177 domain-containing protein
MVTETLPTTIEPKALAAREATMRGAVSLSDMPRLGEQILDEAADIPVTLVFCRDDNNRVLVKGTVETAFTWRCQRCWQPYQMPQQIKFVLSPVESDEQAKELPADVEPLILDECGKITLVSLIEDECLLACPLVVKHPEGQCSPPPSDDEVAIVTSKQDTVRSLSGLKSLFLKDTKSGEN